MTSSLTSSMTSSMTSPHEGKSPPPPPSLSDGSIGPAVSGQGLSSRPATTSTRAPTAVDLTPTGVSGQLDMKGFDHDIPDHILQAWPLVHQVHSRKQPPRRPWGGLTGSQSKTTTPSTALTRRKTRSSNGVYRSSVLTPGEVEFMARKRDAKRRAAMVNKNSRRRQRDARPSTDYTNGATGTGNERVFFTQSEGDASVGGSRDQYSRMTNDSRASIVPSTIEVTLPTPRRQDALRRMRLKQELELRLAGSAMGADTSGRQQTPGATPASSLLGREKTEGNNIRGCSARERRRRELERREQQFILQPTTASALDWYESQGLQTPSVLHKYLNEAFYTSLAAKPEVDTATLLNYIKMKQKNSTYVPPPPSSGSEEEQEDGEEGGTLEARLVETHRGFDKKKNTSQHKGQHSNVSGQVRKAISCEDVSLNNNNNKGSTQTDPPPLSMYILDRHPLSGQLSGQTQGHQTQGHPLQERSVERIGGAPRRTIKENGCFDLMVGGDKLTEAVKCPIQAVSNLNINSQKGHMGNQQLQPIKHPHPVVSQLQEATSYEHFPEIEVRVTTEDGLEKGGSDEESQGDIDHGHQEERLDNTKRIMVVLPSSDISVENLSVKTSE